MFECIFIVSVVPIFPLHNVDIGARVWVFSPGQFWLFMNTIFLADGVSLRGQMQRTTRNDGSVDVRTRISLVGREWFCLREEKWRMGGRGRIRNVPLKRAP